MPEQIVTLSYMLCVLQEFNLIDRKELAPLQELSEKFTAKEER